MRSLRNGIKCVVKIEGQTLMMVWELYYVIVTPEEIVNKVFGVYITWNEEGLFIWIKTLYSLNDL